MREDEIKKFLIDEKGFSRDSADAFIVDYKTLPIDEQSKLIFEIVGKYIYNEYPIDIYTFIHDPNYLGLIYGDILFKLWEDLLLEIYPAPLCKRYNEVILSCGTRSGKTSVTVITALYELHLLLCMINPQKTLVGKSSASLVFNLLSKDNSTACSQLGGDIHKGLTLSPYFSEKITEKLSFSNLDKKGVDLGHGILLKAGSTVNVVTGTDMVFGCLDEANMPSPKISADMLVEERLKIYNEMLDRRSATLSKAPSMSGLILLLSSPMDEGDVIGERIDVVKQKNIPNVLIRDDIARWEARGEQTEDTFDFFLGTNTMDPCVIEDTDIRREDLPKDKIIQVPRTLEYYNAFTLDPYNAIRSIAGRRTAPECSLFNTVSIFREVFFRDDDIFTKPELDVEIDNMLSMWDFLVDKDYFKHPRNPKCWRYIHLDIASKRDRFGLASVYADRVTYTAEDNSQIRIRKYFVDFCVGVKAKGGKTVDILKVLEFIYSLKKMGYPLKVVTTDNHQGELARQIIQKHGVNTEYLSVEESHEPYFNLKNLIMTRTLEGYKNSILVKELGGLRVREKGAKIKIAKGKGFTDDLSDALAGATYRCSQDPYYKKSNDDVIEVINNFKINQKNLINRNYGVY